MSERREQDKLSHAAVNYESPSHHRGQRCEICVHFIKGIAGRAPRCEGVKPPIRAADWCKRFQLKRGRNPESAEDLYEKFHGRKHRRITETGFPIVDYDSHPKLAQLGKLISLTVGESVKLVGKYLNLPEPFEEDAWAVQIDIDQAHAPDVAGINDAGRGQIYFVGGNQDISHALNQIPFERDGDVVDLGPCIRIEYATEKGFDGFRRANYYHGFGEESGDFPGDNGDTPYLMYSLRKKRLFLDGGKYKIKDVGIVN